MFLPQRMRSHQKRFVVLHGEHGAREARAPGQAATEQHEVAVICKWGLVEAV